jgi:hypothetical protein
MFKSILLNVVANNEQFKSIFTDKFIEEINLVIKNKPNSKLLKIIFIAESKLETLFVFKGGSIEKRLEEIKNQIQIYIGSECSWVLFYLLFSEKKITLITSRNLDHIAKNLSKINQENIFEKNIQKGLQYYMQEVFFLLEESIENPIWT